MASKALNFGPVLEFPGPERTDLSLQFHSGGSVVRWWWGWEWRHSYLVYGSAAQQEAENDQAECGKLKSVKAAAVAPPWLARLHVQTVPSLPKLLSAGDGVFTHVSLLGRVHLQTLTYLHSQRVQVCVCMPA